MYYFQLRPPSGMNPKVAQIVRQAMSIFSYSLYVPAVYRWISVLGRQNVLTIPSESLSLSPKTKAAKSGGKNAKGKGSVESSKLRKSKENNERDLRSANTQESVNKQFRRIYDFLGLCPLAHTARGYQHQSTRDVSAEHTLNNTMREKMEGFYRPFSQLLDLVVGERIGYV
jgi:hypothetical protein